VSGRGPEVQLPGTASGLLSEIFLVALEAHALFVVVAERGVATWSTQVGRRPGGRCLAQALGGMQRWGLAP
jgi:hypothetical protein